MQVAGILLAVAVAAALQAQDAAGVITIDARLVRGDFAFYNQDFPEWRVELKYTNNSPQPVELGETLILLEPSNDSRVFLATSVTRQAAGAAANRPRHSKRYELGMRFGVTWGVEVPETGSTNWPILDFMAAGNRSGVLLAILSGRVNIPRIAALPGAGYGPPLRPGEERKIVETVLFPYDQEIKGERESVVVIPPGLRAVGSPVSMPPRVITFPIHGIAPKYAEFPASQVTTLPGGTGELRSWIADETRPLHLRIHALNWLAESQPALAGDPLIELAKPLTKAPYFLHSAAILNLGTRKVPGALPVLLNLIQTNPETKAQANARLAAITAVGELADPAAAPVVRSLAGDPDEDTARHALGAIAALGDAGSVPAVRDLLLAGRRTPSPEKRKSKARDTFRPLAARTLIAIGTGPANEALRSILQNRKVEDAPRSAAAAALGLEKARWSVPALASLATDEKDRPEVREQAIRALGDIGGEEAAAAVRSAASSKNKRVRNAANLTLNQKWPPKGREFTPQVP